MKKIPSLFPFEKAKLTCEKMPLSLSLAKTVTMASLMVRFSKTDTLYVVGFITG